MIYFVIGVWTVISLLVALGTKSIMNLIYMLIYGLMIMVIGVGFKLLRNMAARSLEEFITIEGIIVEKDKKSLIKTVERPSITRIGNVRDNLNTQYNYIVVKTHEDVLYQVFVSEVPYARIWSKVKAIKDVYEVGDQVAMSVTKYDYGFYIAEEFWVRFYQ